MTVEERNLASLEIMRDFVGRVVPVDVYLKNLVLDGVDDSNLRLWALRESTGLDEEAFAARLGMSQVEYHRLERRGTAVPPELLSQVAEVFGVAPKWLLCKQAFVPVPAAANG